MTVFDYAHAGVTEDGPITRWQGWPDLLNHCLRKWPEQARGLGLLYVTEPLAGDLEEILAQLRARTGLADWVGAVAPAICATGTDYFDTPAMAVMALDVDAEDYRVVPPIAASDALDRAVGPIAGWITERHPRLAVVHGDPRCGDLLALIPAAAAASEVYLVGGLTSTATETCQIAGGPVGGGLSGVIFAESVAVASGLTQGCSPIGPLHTITGMADRAISALNERPALDVFMEDIGEVLARDLRRVAGYVHAAIPVSGSDTGDYMVRNLAGIDFNRGWLVVGAELAVGDRLMFVRRDTASAVEDMRRMVESLKQRAGSGIRGALYHSCIARGPNQFGPGARELTLIREALGEVPLIGFFGNGEICNDRLYTYTGVLSLFLDGPP